MRELNRPLVVGTLVGSLPIGSQLNKAKASSIDILEIRLDTFPISSDYKSLLKKIRRAWRNPVLLTFRFFKEGGKRKVSESARFSILESLLAMAHMVDVEIQAKPLAQKITRLAHKKRLKVLHSYHNFSRIPPASVLKKLCRASRRLKGDMFKVAVQPKNDRDLMTFLFEGQRLNHSQKVLIGMGKVGLVSRFVGFSFGSRLTYGHLGQRAAPGQVSVRELTKSVRDIYGR